MARRFVKIERGIVPKEEFDKHVPAHMEYVRALQQTGRYVETGYWKDAQGGMLLFDADSMADAQRIVAGDPLVAHGCVEYELHEWCRVVNA